MTDFTKNHLSKDNSVKLPQKSPHSRGKTSRKSSIKNFQEQHMMPQEYPFRLIPGRHRDRVLARYLASIDLPHLIDDIEHPNAAEFFDDDEAALSILQNPPLPPPLPPSDFLAGAAFFREAAYFLDERNNLKEKGKDDRKKYLLTNAVKREILKESKAFSKEPAENRREFVISLLVSTMMGP